MDMPAKTARYLGPITDNARWDNFQHRPDDIFICTPPKCGTTWTQAICAMLVFGKADHGVQTSTISPWIDAAFAPIEAYLEQTESLDHRRFIKTHTPLDGIPYYPECTYLCVMRDPRDAFFSGLNHRDNMTDEELAFSVFPSGDSAFTDWLERDGETGAWDLQALSAFTQFFKTYWDHRDVSNIHMFHYSDMKRDLRGAIARMADAVGIAVDDARLDAYAAAADFSAMKQKAEQFAPESGTGMWKAETAFFATGKSKQWQDRLSADELAAFDARLAELLLPDESAWLLNGIG